MSKYQEIAKQGLWSNNPGLVQLLGLCPLLAVTATITNALGLGIATLIVLVGSNILVSLVRDFVPKEIRIPVFVMIIAALVTITRQCLCIWLVFISGDFLTAHCNQLRDHRSCRSFRFT